MTNNLINIGLSGLNAAAWGLNATGQNISNLTTPGYSRVRPVYQETPGNHTASGYMPQGVTTSSVQRVYSDFLNREMNNALAKNSSLATYYALATELSNYVGNPVEGFGKAMTGYFNGLQSVANSPATIAARQSTMSAAQMLADQVHAAASQYDQLRVSTNMQIAATVADINNYAKQIAQLNSEIAIAGAKGQPPNDLLDRRDLAISRLSELIGGQVVEGADGVSVYMAGGQPLVQGSNRYELVAVSSPSDPTELSVAWLGRAGADPKQAPVDLADSTIQDGTLGGLFKFRRETLDPAQARLGAIAVSFAEQVNRQNTLGLDLNGRQGGDLFAYGAPTTYANSRNVGGAQLNVTFADGVKPPVGDYALAFDGTTYTLSDRVTGSVVGTATGMPASINGMNFDLNGTMAPGDSFTVLPTRGVLNGFGLATTDPSAIAAASPVLGGRGANNMGSGKLTASVSGPNFAIPDPPVTITFQSTPAPGQLAGFPVGSTVTIDGTPPTSIDITSADTPVPYDPSKGIKLSVSSVAPGGLSDVRIELSGKPADGDTFTIASNAGGQADGSNALALANLLNAKAFTTGTTLTGAFADYVNTVGNTADQLKAAANVQNSVLSQVVAAQQSVSGVNRDEEAANLMYFQQLYQANSKVIQMASTMFDTVLGIFR